jgi:uracil phosphoribosyltransferase
MASESKPTIPRESVGPDYLERSSKPEATVSTAVGFPNVHVLAQTPQLIALLT